MDGNLQKCKIPILNCTLFIRIIDKVKRLKIYKEKKSTKKFGGLKNSITFVSDYSLRSPTLFDIAQRSRKPWRRRAD
jgi:hypothetical protein